MPEPTKEITAESIRKLETGQTLSLVDYLDTSLTIEYVIEHAAKLKERAYRRFHKTVSRAKQDTGAKLQLATQIIWNDRYGMAVLTTITRKE